MTTPSERLRALHRDHSIAGPSRCAKCHTAFPCDTIKALDAADTLADAVEGLGQPALRIEDPLRDCGYCLGSLPAHDIDCPWLALTDSARAYRGTQ